MYPTRVADRTSSEAHEVRADERRAIEAVLGGDRKAFRLLVERHQRGIYGVIYRLVHSAADAEDLAQQAFLSAFDALGRFDLEARFSSWIYRIAVNLAKDHLKSRQRGEQPSAAEPSEALFAGLVPPTDQPAVAAERHQLISQALGALSWKDREVLVLKDLEELSYEEMGEILHRPITALKIRVLRARSRLKAELERRCAREAL
jgi:RNA polymerase sigma-70 factor (ECF subfamily)